MAHQINVLVIVVLCAAWASATWDYAGPYGPSTWATSYPKCGAGQQSPVSINPAIASLTPDVTFTWGSTGTPAGRTIASVVPLFNSIALDAWASDIRINQSSATEYRLHSINFNVPAEHAVDGVTAPIEMKWLFINAAATTSPAPASLPDDGVVFVQRLQVVEDAKNSETNAMLQSILDRDDPTALANSVTWLEPLIFPSGTAYSYSGKRSVPPCVGPLLHYVFASTPAIDANVYRAILNGVTALPGSIWSDSPNTARPTQTLLSTTSVSQVEVTMPEPAGSIDINAASIPDRISWASFDASRDDSDVNILQSVVIMIVVYVVLIVAAIAVQAFEGSTFVSFQREEWVNPISKQRMFGGGFAVEGDDEDDDDDGEEGEEEEDEEWEEDEDEEEDED